MKSKKKALTPEEKLSQALLPREEWPYELPKGWVWTRLGATSEIIMGQSPSGDSITNDINDIPLIGGASDMGKLYPEVTRYTTAPTKLSKKNDLILCIRATLGRPIYSDGIYCLGRGVAAVRPQILLKEYLKYFIAESEQYLYQYATGTTFLQVNSKTLLNMPIPLPSIHEQQRIVNKIESLFAKLDEAGDRLQKVLDGYEARRAAILHEAFSGKWTGDHGAGDMSVPKGWRKVKLSDVCTINPKKLDTSSLEDSLEVSFIPMASVDEVLGEVTKPDVRNLGKVKKGFTNFQEGDVVFAKITPCMENGKSAVIGPLLNDIGYGTTEFYVLRCHPELYNRFLYHLVRSIKFRSEAKSQMTGAVGQQRVPKNFMADYEILLPPLNEQIQIVQMVDTFFKKEYEVRKMSQNVIEQISLLKKSILARAFRGELGTQDSSDPSALELLKECVLAGKEVSKS